MNIIKVGLVLLTGVGFGIGMGNFVNLDAEINDDVSDEYYAGFCHGSDQEEFLEHMLENVSAEDKVLIETKIDALLVEYGVTLEEVFADFDLRHDFMNELMDYLKENTISYQYEDDGWHHGGGMHHYPY